MDSIVSIVIKNFFHIPLIAGLLIALFIFFLGYWIKSLSNKKLSIPSKFAPSVMTATGLLGTFFGLTSGLQDLNLQNQASMQALIDGLKSVFIYSLVGVASAILFMLLNMIPTALQIRENRKLYDRNHHDIKNRHQKSLNLQEEQRSYLADLSSLQDKQLYLLQQSLDSQNLMQQDIAKLQFDNDNEQLATLISKGVVQGLSPLLYEIKTAVADQGTEAIKKVLEDLKSEILVPMNGALDHTNTALETTNQAIKATIIAIKESQEHNDRLIAVVGEAAGKMQSASDKMNGLVDKIDDTVQHMDDIQVKQHNSLENFNTNLQESLGKIQPAIEKGLETARHSLTTAISEAALLMQNSINNASNRMQDNIHTVLDAAGTKLQSAVNQATTNLTESIAATIEKQNESINESFKQFDVAQDKLNTILNTFSSDINGHLDRMATELETIGKDSEHMINTASENLEKTLGDIDHKLLNTTEVLKDALKIFRDQYQESLTTYLNQQTENLNGFLNRQNEQLEQTIGKQRLGLEAVTVQLETQFKEMCAQQQDINKAHTQLIHVIGSTETSLLPKVQTIALELKQGEEKLGKELHQSAKHLTTVSKTLADIGQQLPEEFTKAFKELDKTYQDAFKDLDSGLKHAVNNLGSAIAGVNTALSALTNAVQMHDTLNQY